jgi:V8-like Glu-specific endopeptidase
MKGMRFVVAGLAVLVLAVAAAGCMGDDEESTNETSTSAPKADVATSASIGAAAESDDDILEYWTPEREAEAQPRDIVRSGSPPAPAGGGPQAGPFPIPDATGEEGSAPGASTSQPQSGSFSPEPAGPQAATRATPRWVRYTGNTKQLPFKQIGVLFFVDPSTGDDYTCSASVVNSANASVIWTAGHCVYDPDKDVWMTKVKFAPGYAKPNKPYGDWPVKMQPGPLLYSTIGWTRDGDFDYDFGAVVVARKGGKRIGDVVGGGQGILWNPKNIPVLADLGYPANPQPPFFFGRPYVCGSKVVTRDKGQPAPLGIDCYFGEGASGGPWIVDYRRARGWGYVVSVNSYGYTNTRKYYYGPYPGDAVKGVYDAVKSK